MKKNSFFIFLFLICIFSSSCNSLFYLAYGIHEPKVLSANSIKKLSNKYGISAAKNYELKVGYYEFLKALDSNTYNAQIQNHLQPLQALYYNPNGQMISYHVNCYAGGFPNLNWNQEGAFNTFPPKTIAPLDSILSLDQLKKYLNPISENQIFSPKPYPVVVFWNRMMGRQTKRLIKLVKENAKGINNEDIDWYFVNNDNLIFEAFK